MSNIFLTLDELEASGEDVSDFWKGNEMNDQISVEMAEANKALEALKAAEAAGQVAVQTPDEIGNEEKPVVQ